MDELQAVARSELQAGWRVYDADGTDIGSVERVDETSFSVRVSGPVDTTLSVPFEQIESADDGRVELGVSSGELTPLVDDTPAA